MINLMDAQSTHIHIHIHNIVLLLVFGGGKILGFSSVTNIDLSIDVNMKRPIGSNLLNV